MLRQTDRKIDEYKDRQMNKYLSRCSLVYIWLAYMHVYNMYIVYTIFQLKGNSN